KRFDRDKSDLRAIGVVIEYKAEDPSGQPGYVIDKQGYFLPELSLDPEDAMLLAVLQRALGVVDDELGRNLKSALAKMTVDSSITRRGGAEFDVPADFDVGSRMGAEEFEYDEGAPTVVVTLEADEVATWLLERRLHGGGTLTRRADGTGLYEVSVRSEEGLFRWLAELGPRVRLLAPPRLATAFRERTEKARALYADVDA